MDERDSAETTAQPEGVVRPPPGGTLWSVQVLRAVAALMVVTGHVQSAVAGVVAAAGGHFARSTLLPWGASVDLFFVISGFIMVHASARLFGRPGAWREFLRRRLIRIAPLYWLTTTGFLVLLAAAALKGGDAFPAPGAILASYAFVPADTHGDGRLFPIYDLGWTLNYEMAFYALMALVVGWPRRRALTLLALLIAALVGVGFVLSGPSAPWFWTRPILVDFALGLGVGALVARGIVLPRAARAVLAAGGIALFLADPLQVFSAPLGATVANAWPRVLLAGWPAAVVLAAALLGPEPPLPRVARWLPGMGDASYSLYLLHPVALIAMEKLAQKLPAVGAAPGWMLAVATIAAAVAIGLLGHRWIERPMTAWLARLSAPRPRAGPTSRLSRT